MNKVRYERTEMLPVSKVRQMCINHNFYTCGDCQEYEAMFDKCATYNGTNEALASIAWDIIDHSDKEELDDYGFDTVYEIVAWIMHLLITECMYTTVQAVEVEE